ncbi:hypothetical protein DL95DRAFT_231652, partial [Leptodontidium sp. 2 PMI_412]
MDPITAVGFAASILTFIDFSYKVVTGTAEVFQSGSTSKNTHLSEIIGDLKNASEKLKDWPTPKSDHEKALQQLSVSCQEVAQRLVNLLARLSTTPGKSKWMSVRVVLRGMKKDGEVEELENTLDKYRSQIILRLIQIVSDQQLQLQIELCDFRTQSRKDAASTLDELESLRNGLLGAVESGLQDIKQQGKMLLSMPEGYNKSAPGPLTTSANLDNQLAHIDELRESLDQILAMKDTPTPEMRILQQLWVDDMYAREDKIQKAEGETFQWILWNSDKSGVDTKSEPLETEDAEGNQNDEKPSSSNSQSPWYVDTEVRKLRQNKRSILQDWLKHGSNVFHISGKAGSGKSTLMKLIVDDQRTYDFLQDWAGGKELITAQFFFWRAGSDVQRSRQGLYRCLLFEILKECPHLIRKVFPGTYKIFERKSRANTIDQSFFRPEHIATAFQTLVSLSPTFDHRMCLFVDGLDEYGDDTVDSYEYENLAKSLAIWTKNDHIKILCSSRPHREFLDTFTEDLRIHLHEVNAPDIQLFSRQMFEKDDQFLSIKDQYVDLVKNIVSYSAGVFLWARLVVRSLIASIHRRDPVDSLKAQLEVAPKDLNKLYEHFFASISKLDQERAFRMLLLVAHKYPNQVNALFLSWLDHLHEPKFPTACEIKPYTDQEIQKKHEDVQRQIAGLTHGLLEMRVITHRNGLFFSRSIQFFHRSARDFVLQNSQLQKFQTEHPETISPDTYLRLDLAELWF